MTINDIITALLHKVRQNIFFSRHRTFACHIVRYRTVSKTFAHHVFPCAYAIDFRAVKKR